MQIKSTVRDHWTLFRMAAIKIEKQCGWGHEKWEVSGIAAWMETRVAVLWDLLGGALKASRRNTPWPTNSVPRSLDTNTRNEEQARLKHHTSIPSNMDRHSPSWWSEEMKGSPKVEYYLAIKRKLDATLCFGNPRIWEVRRWPWVP